MKIVNVYGNDYLVPDPNVDFQVFICATSGYGKTLSVERLVYLMHKLGYFIVILNDAKNLTELGFFQFDPSIMLNYHKKAVKESTQPIEPCSIPVKLYHPFTFKLPKYKIPEMEIVTIPIKDLGTEEFLFLLETEDDKTNLDILQNSQTKLKHNQGWFEFANQVNKETSKESKKFGKTEIILRSPDSFGFKSVAAGNVRNIGSLYNTFFKFRQHYFLQSQDYPMNMNWEKFFEDQNTIKFISTKYLKDDEKTSNFWQMYVLNSIIRKRKQCKYKILIVIDEIKDLCPDSDKRGFKQILSSQITRCLNTLFRSNGIDSVSTSQSIKAVDKTLLDSNVFTLSIYGNIQGKKDLELLHEVEHYERSEVKIIQNLPKGRFSISGIGSEYKESLQYGSFKVMLSPTPHCERMYRFDDIFEKQFPERMTNYSDLIKQVKEELNLKEREIIEENKIALQELEYSQQKKEKVREKQKGTTFTQKESEEQEKMRIKEERRKRNLAIYQQNKAGISTTILAKQYNVSQPMVVKIIKKVKEKWQTQEQSVSMNENQ